MIHEKGSISENSQDIPLLYIWFGKTVPEDYLISIS
jgi:hypothetical protein